MKGSGEKDRRITLERATVTKDATGGEIADWSALHRPWAHRRDVSDGERLSGDERAAELSARYVIDWSSEVASLSALDRVVEDGLVFQIFGVKELGRRTELEITVMRRSEGRS